MITEIKNLSKMRKLYLTYQFLLNACNIFLVAVTVQLLIELFGDVGIIVRDYSMSLFGLLLFLPFISKYIADNPKQCYPWIVLIEISAVAGYMAAAKGFYPATVLIVSMLIMGSSNTIVRPLRTKNGSRVINNDSNYAVLSERLNAITLVGVTLVGLLFLKYDVSVDWNAGLTFLFLLCSRIVYHFFLEELDRIDKAEADAKVSEKTT